MELLLECTNIRKLKHIITNLPDSVTHIKAAIAYSTSNELLKKAIEKEIQFDWWGLFNEEGATSK